MTQRQVVAVLAPPLLIASMYGVSRALHRALPGRWRVAWYLTLAIYWLVWGGVFAPWVAGRQRLWEVIGPLAFNLRPVLLVLLMLALASLYRLVPGMDYQKPSTSTLWLLISTTVGNGVFEELLWRGVYLVLFPGHLWWGVVWPSVWFGVWHYVPGSLDPKGNVAGLMVGSGLMGFYLSFLARQTGRIGWTMLAHFLGGLIMVR